MKIDFRYTPRGARLFDADGVELPRTTRDVDTETGDYAYWKHDGRGYVLDAHHAPILVKDRANAPIAVQWFKRERVWPRPVGPGGEVSYS